MTFNARLFCSAVAVLALVSCAKPVTQAPNVSSAELAQERAVHEAAVNASGKGGSTALPADYNRNAYMARLKPMADRISNAAAPYCQSLRTNCRYNFALDKDEAPLNAYADGKNVVISPAMMAFASNDNELALVVAHEMAHNILTHPGKTQQNAMTGMLGGTVLDALLSSQGLNTGGQLGKLGAQQGVLRYSQDFERDADYLGIYIAKTAGYDVSNAPNFWQRMSVNNPQAVYIAQSHPSNPERSVLLRKAIAEIESKQQSGQTLMPALRPKN